MLEGQSTYKCDGLSEQSCISSDADQYYELKKQRNEEKLEAGEGRLQMAEELKCDSAEEAETKTKYQDLLNELGVGD